MARVHLVRHGRATAGWDVDPDPGLDDVGVAQAVELAARLAPLGRRPILTSPFRRCRETAAPLAQRWGVTPDVAAAVAEIPSPPGVPMGGRVPWLREAMTGTWADLGDRYTEYRDAVVAFVAERPTDTLIVSHFVAINAVIGACAGDDRLVIRSLDNTSVTVIANDGGRLTLVEAGHEADTLLR
jgi:broad specificity phosphatase PhoE